jgi:HSP90 family molecular chaperone
MELFKNIRLKIGQAILSKKMAKTKRKVFYSNFSQIRKIGIVWDATNTTDFSSLSRFYQKMHEKNIEVSILGYFQGNELPDKYTALRYLTCLKKKELNYFYIPLSTEATSFIQNRFDVLIDVNFNKIFTLNYLTILSESAFKVGLFESDKIDSPFDLMIEIKSPVSTENYLDQVVHYLDMIEAEAISGDKKVKNR